MNNLQNINPPGKPGSAASVHPGGAQKNQANGPQGQGAPEIRVLPMAGPAVMHKRHWGILASLVLCVVIPALLVAAYLWLVADDRYASKLGFTVHSENSGSASELLGGLASLTGSGTSSASDSNVLYEYIRSQEIVRKIDEQLDLRGHYSAGYSSDPLFRLPPGASVEELEKYWQRIVQVSYDSSTGLTEVKVTAFDPGYAQKVARAIVQESQDMVNRLADAAQADTLRYALDELEETQTRLRATRAALTEFRTRTQIVDIDSDLESRTGVLTNLQQQLAQELVNLDEMKGSIHSANDQRITQSERRIEVIRDRIAQERANLAHGMVSGTDQDYPTLMSQYEGLKVDNEFARNAYVAARAACDAARAEAARQSRYLATYIPPTLAETAEYPRRGQLLGLTALFLLLSWGIIVLVYYSIRDRS